MKTHLMRKVGQVASAISLAGILATCHTPKKNKWEGLPTQFYTMPVPLEQIDPTLLEAYKEGDIPYALMIHILEGHPGMGRKLIEVTLPPEEEKRYLTEGYLLNK